MSIHLINSLHTCHTCMSTSCNDQSNCNVRACVVAGWWRRRRRGGGEGSGGRSEKNCTKHVAFHWLFGTCAWAAGCCDESHGRPRVFGQRHGHHRVLDCAPLLLPTWLRACNRRLSASVTCASVSPPSAASLYLHTGSRRTTATNDRSAFVGATPHTGAASQHGDSRRAAWCARRVVCGVRASGPPLFCPGAHLCHRCTCSPNCTCVAKAPEHRVVSEWSCW